MLNPVFRKPRRVGGAYRLASAALFGLAVVAGTAASAAAAPATPTPPPACVSIPGATTIVSLIADASGQLSLPCTPQPGQQLVIVGQAAQQQADDRLGSMLDPRVDSYAKRQAIRDKYRGQINETTFNDELGDGVSLDQALADAMAEFGKAH